MKTKRLCAVIALTLGAAMSAHAGDWDGRWYFAPWLGGNHNDSSRNTNDNSVLVGIGMGKYVAPNTTVDLFVDRTSRNREAPFTGTWATENVGLAVRYYFFDEASWQPFLMAGVGMDHHGAQSEQADGSGGGSESQENFGWDPALQMGVGLARSYSENVRFRAELAYHYDMDDNSQASEDHYGDVQFKVGLMIGFDQPAAAAPTPAPATAATTAAAAAQVDRCKLDDDKDGVNNCLDKCPGTTAGSIVGPDGCEQKVVIDLRGVNFNFDYPKKGETDIAKAGLTEGSMALLDQAVDVLKRYPNVKVEVDGHTDAVGTDEYNQGLSERRARIVYDYLVGHGVDGSRLMGPKGFGEGTPIDTNKTKEGRARNRRTELVVQ